MEINKRAKIIIKKGLNNELNVFEELLNTINLNKCNDIYNENNTTCIKCKYKEDCQKGF